MAEHGVYTNCVPILLATNFAQAPQEDQRNIKRRVRYCALVTYTFSTSELSAVPGPL